MMTIKYGRLKCINKGNNLYNVPTYYMKFLKYDYFLHQIESIHHIQLKNHPIKMKVQNALNTMDHNFTSTFGCNSNWCGEKCVAKESWNWRHKARLMSRYNASPIIMGQIPPKGFNEAKRQATPRICAIQFGMWLWESTYKIFRMKTILKVFKNHFKKATCK
jgi:hypothetical protein